MTCAPCLLAGSVWLGGWLRGEVSGDDLLEALARLSPDAATAGVPELLGLTRRAGADAVWWLSPRPGRTLGWPTGLTEAPEPAVLITSGEQPVGLLRVGGLGWRLHPAPGAAVRALAAEALPVRAATRAFAEILGQRAGRLEALGLDRAPTVHVTPSWAPALARLPRALDPRAADLLHRIGALLDALQTALADEGAAVTATESRLRAGELRELAGQLEDLASAVVGGLSMSPVAWAG